MFDRIVEPFAGGAGYSLRHAHNKVILCETDQHVFKLWRWLIHEATDRDILDIPISIPEGTDIRTLGLSDGQALLLKSWQRTNNVGNCWTISPWGNKPGQWTANTRSRVSSEVECVKHWHILPDGLLTMRLKRLQPLTWFIDPPYQYNYQYKALPLDYAALADTVRSLRGQTIVCEARHPKTDEKPTWLPFDDWGSRITSRRKEGEHTHSRELLFTNKSKNQ